MNVVHHHPVHEVVVRKAVDNLGVNFPEVDHAVIRDLVSEAFVRISDRGRSAVFVGMLAERHVHDALRRERVAALS